MANTTPRLVGSGRYAGLAQLHQVAPIVERLHAVIEELRLNAPAFTPTARLVERTGSSPRTLQRDISRLADAGVPIDRKRGPGGGFRIAAKRQPDRIQLDHSETAALIVSLVSLGPYTSASSTSALAKLLASTRAQEVADSA